MQNVLRKLSTFVMAGGRGERLHPLTRDRTKPAVPFGGVYRIIDFTLSNCINSGIGKIHILTQYKSISLARHLKLGWNIFHSELGEYVNVLPAQQRYGTHWYRGTADAIYQNIYTIEREDPDYVLILAGDHIYKMDYAKMLQAHVESGADVIEAEHGGAGDVPVGPGAEVKHLSGLNRPVLQIAGRDPADQLDRSSVAILLERTPATSPRSSRVQAAERPLAVQVDPALSGQEPTDLGVGAVEAEIP